MKNTTTTLNAFIEMCADKEANIVTTDVMVNVELNGKRRRVYKDALVDMIRIREDVRAADALAYTQFIKGRPEPRKEKIVKDSKVSTRNEEDFGKIRFCRDCGLQVMETVDSDVSVCPKCGEKHEYDKEEYTYNMDDEVVYDFNDPDGTQKDNLREYITIQPDFFDGYKWANKAYLKTHPKVSAWLRANRGILGKIKSEWVDGEELSLSMDMGSGDTANPAMRDVSPEEAELMKSYSTRMTEVSDRKVIGLRTGFRRNLLRNPKVAAQRLDALRPLVSKEEIERLEYLLDDTTSIYEYVFKAKVHAALHAGIIDMRWVNRNKYSLKGKMWKYTSAKNKAYWTRVSNNDTIK